MTTTTISDPQSTSPTRRTPRPSGVAQTSSLLASQTAPEVGKRLLYAGSPGFGASIVAHDFHPAALAKWPGTFPPDALELCLNLAGCGRIRHAGRSLDFESRSAGFYGPGKSGCEAWRDPGQRHQFIVMQFSRSFLRERLSGFDGAAIPLNVGPGTRLGGLSGSHPHCQPGANDGPAAAAAGPSKRATALVSKPGPGTDGGVFL